MLRFLNHFYAIISKNAQEVLKDTACTIQHKPKACVDWCFLLFEQKYTELWLSVKISDRSHVSQPNIFTLCLISFKEILVQLLDFFVSGNCCLNPYLFSFNLSTMSFFPSESLSLFLLNSKSEKNEWKKEKNQPDEVSYLHH